MGFQRLNSEAEILDLLNWHSEHSDFAVIDVETSSKYPRQAKLLDIQISGRGEEEVAIFSGQYVKLLLQLALDVVLVGHNYKYDAHVLFNHGVNLLDRTWRDTLLIGHLVDENRESYSLDSYVQEYWQDDYKKEFWSRYRSYEEADEEERKNYACKDIIYTKRLYLLLMGLAKDRESIPDSLIEHTHRLQDSLLKTEIEGIKVDTEYLTCLGIKLKTEIDRLRPKMRESVAIQCELWEMEEYGRTLQKYKTDKGRASAKIPEFSFDSPKQLSNVIYGKLGLPVQTNEKTKQISTDSASFDKLVGYHPVIPLIQEYREYQKVFTSFIEGTRERLDNGRIYPSFRVSGTATGRISHSNPNLGQLPAKGGIRGMYVPDQGYVLISADYCQLEVNVEANLTGDVSLARIFREGLSKHDITASELKIPRDTAKTLNFALQYWASHYKVAKLLKVSEDEAKRIWNNYWKLYSGPRRLKESTDLAVNEGKPLVTVFGRRRRFERRKRSPWDGDYRQAYNFLIQGTGADITSRAFYLTSDSLQARGFGRGLFSVHDELIIEVKKEVAKEAEDLMIDIMVNVGKEIGLKIPLKAESSGPMLRWESE